MLPHHRRRPLPGLQKPESQKAGSLDFPKILDILCKNGVTEYALVEQDDCYGASPFDCLKESYESLSRWI
jgi:hypothetical protein